jgi:hypothetical protein
MKPRKRVRRKSDARADVYNAQPDSSGVIGGHRGEQEFGVEGEIVKDAEHHIIENPGAEAEDERDDVELNKDPLPYGEMDSGFPGISEWSAESGLLPEDERIDDQENAFRHLNRGDAQIRADLLDRLGERRELDLHRLRVDVDHGNVVLNGVVHSYAEAIDIREVAEAIAGVRGVESHVRVAP